jgi:acyl-CoA synthetase (AMP-forming)/AMP-acid ligase II
MRGYYKRVREDTFSPDGFFATGDRCSIDEDGFLFFDGRYGEMIKTNGANVSPREVEVALERHPDVREAAVFGVPDPQRGEAVVAVIVPRKGATPDTSGIITALRDELSHFKVPQVVVAMADDDVPRTGTGKMRKRELRHAVIAQWHDLGAAPGPGDPGAIR